MIKEDINLEAVRIKKVGVVSIANLSAILNLFTGLIMGIFVFLFTLILPDSLVVSGILAFLVGPFALIVMPISLAIFGWIGGAIGGLFYNLSAKITKGVVLYA